MTMTDTIERLDRLIANLEKRRNAATGAERQELDEAILETMRRRMHCTRDEWERDAARGVREHAAWYDYSREIY